MRRTLAALAAATLAAACGTAAAQGDYPSKPVRLVVGFAAGGISDVLARALAVKLAPNLGQQVIVDNKPGAGTTIAGDFVSKSAPDGYTIWLHDITTHAINASLYAKLPYDSLKDFTPVTLVASTPLMLVVHPSTPASSVRELVALLKARPGHYSYGSSGNGTIVHLSAEMLKSAAGGVDVLHVPYKGSAPATTAILAGEVTFVFSTMPPAVSNVRGGKLRALGGDHAAAQRGDARRADDDRGRSARLRDRALQRNPRPGRHERGRRPAAKRRVREGGRTIRTSVRCTRRSAPIRSPTRPKNSAR